MWLRLLTVALLLKEFVSSSGGVEEKRMYGDRFGWREGCWSAFLACGPRPDLLMRPPKTRLPLL
jgi:hypothetical protein